MRSTKGNDSEIVPAKKLTVEDLKKIIGGRAPRVDPAEDSKGGKIWIE